MTWDIEFLEEAKKDMKKLDHSVQVQVFKGIRKVQENPLPIPAAGSIKRNPHKTEPEPAAPPLKQEMSPAGDLSHKKAIYQSEFSKLRFAEAILILSGEARTATFHNTEERTVKKWK